MPYNLMPYTNLHELNLDWIISRIKEINETRTETAGYAAEAKLYRDAAGVHANNALASANSATMAMNTAQDAATLAGERAGQAAASATQAQQYAEHIADPVAGLVTQWLQAHVDPDTGYVIDNTLTIAGAAADAFQTGLIKDGLNLIQSYDWKPGYIAADGRIVDDQADRRYSAYLVCGGNETITYTAERNANISGISFYDSSKSFIGGVAYTGETAQNTVTSPSNAYFFRLSTLTTLVRQSGAILQTGGLVTVRSDLGSVASRLAPRYVPFITTGTNRSQLYRNISDMLSVYVTDDSYDITLYYNNDTQNTGWSKVIDVSAYPNPSSLQIRKSDNSLMPAGSSVSVAESIQASTVVTFNDLKAEKTVYVSPSGNDDNNGFTRNTPFATIQHAVDSGAKNILVKEGTYTNGIVLNNINGVSILIDHYYDAYTVGTDEDNPKIIIDGAANSLQNGVSVSNCTNCQFGNIEVTNTTGRGFYIWRCDNLRFDDCIAHDIGIGSSGSIGGFMLSFTNADFYNCICYNIGTTTAGTGANHYDGFNIHGTGTTNFINCAAWNCEDDGISHHDACTGLIDGGEWFNCGKGGIASPTHGSKVNISNVYCHDNYAGIYSDSDHRFENRGNTIFSNCVCKNNQYDMIVGNDYHVIAINCVYDTVRSGTENNITRFGIIT